MRSMPARLRSQAPKSMCSKDGQQRSAALSLMRAAPPSPMRPANNETRSNEDRWLRTARASASIGRSLPAAALRAQ